MICKYCGMESTTTDRCSMCGQILTATPGAEAAKQESAPVDQDHAVAPVAVEAAASGETEGSAPTAAPPVANRPAAVTPGQAQSAKPRRPAPAVFSRVGAPGRAVAPPPPSSSRPPVPDFRNIAKTEADAQQPRPSLANPLSDYQVFTETKTASPPTTLTPDAGSAPTRSVEASVDSAAAISTPGAQEVTDTLSATTSSLPASAPPAESAPQPTVRVTAPPRRVARDEDEEAVPMPDARTLTARYAGAFALILIATCALTYLGRNIYAVPLVLAEFIGALLLPVMRVVPWAEDDTDDLMLFILLMLLFGPVISLVIYVCIGLIRQTANPGLVGCMIVAALVRLDVDAALGRLSITATMPFAHFFNLSADLVKKLLLDWSGLVTLAGWYTASVFRRFHE